MNCPQRRRLRGFTVRVSPRSGPSFSYSALAEHSVDVIADALDKHGLAARISVRPYAPMQGKGVMQ